MRSYIDYSQGCCTRGSVYYLAYEHGWQSRNHKAIISIDIIDRYITRRRVLVLQYLNPVLHSLLFFQLQAGLLGGTQPYPVRVPLVEP
jgi:hypothetical protein